MKRKVDADTYRDLQTLGESLTEIHEDFVRLANEDLLKPNEGAPLSVDNDSLPRQVAILRHAVSRCSYSYRVLFAGVYNAGKSEVINTLLDEKDLLPSLEVPYTGVTTRIKYGRIQSFSVKWLDQETCLKRFAAYVQRAYKGDALQERITYGTIDRLIQEKGGEFQNDLRALKGFLDDYETITGCVTPWEQMKMFLVGGGYVGDKHFEHNQHQLFLDECARQGLESGLFLERIHLLMIGEATMQLDNGLLRNGVELIDSPGLGALYQDDANKTQRVLQGVDSIVLISKEAGDQEQQEILREWCGEFQDLAKTDPNREDTLFVILNKADTLRPDSIEKVCDTFFGVLRLQNPQFAFTSAVSHWNSKSALDYREKLHDVLRVVADDPTKLPYPALRRALRKLVDGEDVGGIKALRQQLLTHAEERAHYLKCQDILKRFDSAASNLYESISKDYDLVTHKYSSEDEIRQGLVERYFEAIVAKIGVTADRDNAPFPSGRFHVFLNGYLRNSGPNPAHGGEPARFGREVVQMLQAADADVVASLEDYFAKRREGFDPRNQTLHFSQVDCVRALDEARNVYERAVVSAVHKHIVDPVYKRLVEQLELPEILTELKTLLPTREHEVQAIPDEIERYRDDMRHSLAGRLAECFLELPEVEDVPMPQRGASAEKMLDNLKEWFTKRYRGHFAAKVATPLQRVAAAYFLSDLHALRQRLEKALQDLRQKVVDTNNLRRLDPRDEQFAAVPGEMDEQLRMLQISQFCHDLKKLRETIEATRRNFKDHYRRPMPRQPVNWLKRDPSPQHLEQAEM